jgi:putative transcriptional regulator
MASLAGSFLVAKSSLRDAFFGQTVVLLLQHNEDGAFGLILNRPLKAAGLPFVVFSGGPCDAQGLMMLHGHAAWAEEAEDGDRPEVAPGVFLGDADCFRRVGEQAEAGDLRFRLFKGYSGWGPDQLEGELAQGAWGIVTASAELVFDTPHQELWERLAPPALPQFSVN